MISRLLQGTGPRDDLPEDGSEPLAREGAGVALAQPVDNFTLALRGVNRGAAVLLDAAHLQHHPGPLVELLKNGAIDLVDAPAQLLEFGLGTQRCAARLPGLAHRLIPRSTPLCGLEPATRRRQARSPALAPWTTRPDALCRREEIR